MATHALSTPAPEDGARHVTRRALSAAIEAAIAVLDELEAKGIFSSAIRAAATRSRQLSDEAAAEP